MKSIRLSIVIPTYNNAPHIREAIDSALAQKDVDLEVIVVNDGSTDTTPEILADYGSRIRTLRQENLGAPTARNRGLERATGDAVLFLDADDYLFPSALKNLHRELEAAPEKTISVFGAVHVLDQKSGKIQLERDTFKKRTLRMEELMSHNLLTGRVLHHAENLRKVGGFDPELPRGQEYDLHLRLSQEAAVRFRPVNHPVLVSRRHDHPDRISSGGFAGDDPLYFLRLHEKHIGLFASRFPGGIPSELRRAAARRLWEIGRGLLREGYPEHAATYFAEAGNLTSSGQIAGALPYRLLVGMLGPKTAESVAERLRKFSP